MNFLDELSADTLREQSSIDSFVIPGLRTACGDFHPAVSLTEFLKLFDLTCDENSSLSVGIELVLKFSSVMILHSAISIPGQHIFSFV